MGWKFEISNFSIMICAAGILLLAGYLPVRAAPLPAAPDAMVIDAFVEEQMHRLNIPGLALAVVRGDQIEYMQGYGKAGPSGQSVTPQTPFLAASLSKPVTALAVMQLAEAGELVLDAAVQSYLPWFETADPAVSSQITIRHLLHHASGLSEFEGDVRNLDTDTGNLALETSLRRLRNSQLNAAPGERFEYSNTNYDLLGMLIQTVSGMSYQDYIQEEIFTPLGFQHSYTNLDTARQGGLASGYAAFFGLTLPYDQWMPYSQTVVPSAGLFLSAEDLGHFLIAQLNEGRLPGGKQILSPDGMNQLHTPGIQIGEQVSYAMGWTVFPFPQAALATGPGSLPPTALAHGGDWANYKALMVMIPEHQLGVAVLMNKQDWGQGSAYAQIGWNIALLALELPAEEFPIAEDFITRYGRMIGGVLVVLLIASLAWCVRRLHSISGWGREDAYRKTYVLVFLAILPAIDLVLAGYILLAEVESFTSLRLTLAFHPDAGVLYFLILGLTLGWGTLRSFLAIKRLRTN